jgi:hypothetical protein
MNFIEPGGKSVSLEPKSVFAELGRMKNFPLSQMFLPGNLEAWGIS